MTGPTTMATPAGAAAGRGGICRVGVDLCPVADVARAMTRHPLRYPRSILSRSELRLATPSATQIAMTFAAKEAVAKALAPDPTLPWSWTWIEFEGVAGRPRVRLSAGAAAAARGAGITRVITTAWLSTGCLHTPGPVAVATAIASRGDENR